MDEAFCWSGSDENRNMPTCPTYLRIPETTAQLRFFCLGGGEYIQEIYFY